MATEFSNYIESRASVADEDVDGTEKLVASKDGESVQLTAQQVANLAAGGGAVDSVNGQTGVVVVDAGDIPFTPAGNLSSTDVEAALIELDSEKVAKVNAAVALTDAASIDLTAIKHTLTTSSSRTFTISYTGDDTTLEITLTATTASQTFPAGSLCVSEGEASGDNLLAMNGVSGDKYLIAIKKIGSVYYVVAKNFGQ